jgi:hypothetical protein
MRITATADTSDIRARLRQYTELMGKGMSDGVRQFAVIACRNLANTTQPFSGREKDTSQRGKYMGELAVEVDISKVFYVPTVDGGFSKALTEQAEKSYRQRLKNSMSIGTRTHKFRDRINGYIAQGNFGALRNVAKDMGWKDFRRTVDPAIHQAARTGKRKRVRKPTGGMTLILNKQETLARYIKKRQKLVGLTKAGWAKCADLIPSAKKGSATRGIPQWVTRNKDKSSGSIQDKSRDAKNPKVIMTNKIPWTSDCLTNNEARKAIDLAKRNFVEYIKKTMKGELRRRAKLKGT